LGLVANGCSFRFGDFALEELLGNDDNQDEIDEAIESAILDDGLTEEEAKELYGG